MSDSEEEEQGKVVKITVVGEPSTGKSSLCARFLSGTLGGGGGGGGGSGGSTQGAEVLAGQCPALRPPVPLQLCDVSGAALGTPMLDNYLYASNIVLFVYDLTNLQSFDRLAAWLARVKEVFAPEVKKPLLALFGNKSDLDHQRAVRLTCVQKFASENFMESFKGSARTGEMVQIAITNLVANVCGLKQRKLDDPVNGKAPNKLLIQNSANSLPQLNEHPAQSLIMTRKALRKFQRKESSICTLQ